MTIAVLYARVSTQEQAERGFSLRQQMERLEEWAESEGCKVLEKVEDAGQSGASLQRPGLDRVRDLVRNGGVSVVLAQDRDRFAREPAYLYLLKSEFDEYGTRLRALNDRGDNSPEGELMDGVFDQFAKFERAKTAERSRRGKLRKAREGKIVGTHIAAYGFSYNDARDGYVVDEEEMRVVRRIFEAIGVDRMSINGVKRMLQDKGIPSPPSCVRPEGGRSWGRRMIRLIVLDDKYRPHTYEEVAELVSESVAAKLDPTACYGVAWYNSTRQERTSVTKIAPDGTRVYGQSVKMSVKPKEEWIAIPVPDPGIPREWVDAAREEIRDNRRSSSAGHRCWELSNGVLRCGHCGFRMVPNTMRKRTSKGPKLLTYYRCPTRQQRGKDACPHSKNHNAAQLEEAVWEAMKGLLLEPDELLQTFDRLIEREREAMHGGDPARDTRRLLGRLEELKAQRERAEDMAVEGLMSYDRLRAKQAEIAEGTKVIERELSASRDREGRISELEGWRDSLWMWWSSAEEVMGLEHYSPQQRNELYLRYRVEVVAEPDGRVTLTGALGEPFVNADTSY